MNAIDFTLRDDNPTSGDFPRASTCFGARVLTCYLVFRRPTRCLGGRSSRKSERALDSKYETCVSNLRCLRNTLSYEWQLSRHSERRKQNCAKAEYTFFQPCVRDVRDSYVNRERPTTSTLVVVKQLFRKEFLIEVDAIAVVKD